MNAANIARRGALAVEIQPPVCEAAKILQVRANDSKAKQAAGEQLTYPLCRNVLRRYREAISEQWHLEQQEESMYKSLVIIGVFTTSPMVFAIGVDKFTHCR